MRRIRFAAPAVLGILLAACGSPEDARPRGSAADERKAVYEAVLKEMLVRPGVRRLVLDPRIHRARPITGEAGTEGLRRTRVFERFPDLRADTLSDFETPFVPGRLPADLTASIPIQWFDEAAFDALPKGSTTPGGGDMNPQWDAFHRRFPESSGWIDLSRVGLSGDGSQALVQVSSGSGSLDGTGDLVFLRKEGGTWRIHGKIRLWIN